MDLNPQSTPESSDDSMSATAASVVETESAAPEQRPRGPLVFGKWAWVTWLPFLVFYVGTQSASYLDWVRQQVYEKGHMPGDEETHFGEFPEDNKDAKTFSNEPVEWAPDALKPWLPKHRSWYPQIYMVAIALTLVVMVFAIPGFKIAPFRVSWLSFAVGAIGVVVWVGLFLLDKHYLGLGARFGGLGKREAFQPLVALKDNPTWMYTFVSIRLLGMILVVPIVEEFFLRGFLIRYLDDPDWDEIPLGVTITPIGFWGALAYGPLTHPAEAVAAAAWFGMMMWMYLRTKSIWDCIIAHAITNGLLALYIFQFDAWELW